MGQNKMKVAGAKIAIQPGVHTERFSPFACLWFAATHLVTAIWLVAYASWENYILLLVLHVIFGVGITLGAHRYFSHKTFRAPLWLENFLAIAYTLSFVRAGHGVIAWAASHRLHHAYVDQEYDPHSPRTRGFWHAYAGHFIFQRQDLWQFDQYRHYRPDLAKKPFLVFLDKPSTAIAMQFLWALLIVVVGGYTGKGPGFDPHHAFGYFVWLVCARYVYTQFSHSMAATVAHGTWPFHKMKDTFHTKSDAKNNLIYWATTLGNETWHNVHHAFPKIANNGPYWYHWELDAFLMKILAKMGIIDGLQLISREQYEAAQNRHRTKNRNGRIIDLPTNGSRYFSHGSQMPSALAAQVESFAFTYGKAYDSYLVVEPDREYFIGPAASGVIAFYTWGKYVNVVGGILAPDEQKLPLLRLFFDFCRRNDFTMSFFGIADDEIGLYRQVGFQITKFGEDFRIDLPALDWKGKNYSWVRRQVSFVARHGVTARELRREDCDPQQWPALIDELLALESEQLATKSQARPTKVFQGQLSPDNLGRRRLFAAYDNTGRAEAFLVCNPMADGKAWSIEIYRHRVGGVNGCMAFLFHHVFEAFKREGCWELSLSMNPAVRCDKPMAGDSAFCRQVMTLWDRHLNFILDLRGVYHFKTRFRPRQVPVYVCVYPQVTVGSTLAFLVSCGIIKVHPWRLVKNGYGMLKKWEVRKNLSYSWDVSNA